MFKKSIVTATLLCISTIASYSAKPKIPSIYRADSASAVVKLAAQEIQKYIYLRTRIVPGIKTYTTTEKLPAGSIVIATNPKELASEQSTIEPQGPNLAIQGGSDIAVLYGAYRYAELLGVRFGLHGDVIPDAPYQGSLTAVEAEHSTPLFDVRGLLPFHDFPEGPDTWSRDVYKSYITQMAKMRFNLISFHTYPSIEPNVWVGRPEDIDSAGNVTASYPTALANTALSSSWGYSAKSTADYSSGTALLFEDNVYASPLLQGALPMPKTPDQMDSIFNRTGDMFNDIFSFGKKLGVKSCIGLETPVSIPGPVRQRLADGGIDPNSTQAREILYDGVFSRIMKKHPLDYFWLWTPEEWTWGTPSKESISRTIQDVKIARKVLADKGDPFAFGLSGWVMGPPENSILFDTILPPDDFMSSLSRLCGQERIDLGYRKLPNGRARMPILWMEDDPALTTPQLWVGRLRSDMAEAHASGCTGAIGNFWRTRSIAPNISAFAQSFWDQKGWNEDFGKPFIASPAPENDIRYGGVGTNHFRGIKGSEDAYVYNTQRYDLKGYKVKVPNGTYTITFQFCETGIRAPGQRVFSIIAEDQKVVDQLDVYSVAGADSVYQVVTIPLTVTDYSLDIEFEAITGSTFLSAFVIEGTTADANQIKGTPYERRINVGGGMFKKYEADLSEHVGNTNVKPRDLPSMSFYEDFATAEFGSEVATDIARVLASLDGSEGSEGRYGIRMPRPAAWITGPGVIQVNERPWSVESQKYAFVDTLAVWRDRVKGKGNIDRYDYYINTFNYLRAMAEIGCMRGVLDGMIAELGTKHTDEEKRSYVAAEILPKRIELARQWEKMMRFLLATVSNPGEIGTVINLESQTIATYNFLRTHDDAIVEALGSALPPQADLSTEYTLPARIMVLNQRSVLEAKEPYELKATVLSADSAVTPRLMYREMGRGRFRELAMKNIGRRTYSIMMPEIPQRGLEYYITSEVDGKTICYPATSPESNSVIIRMSE